MIAKERGLFGLAKVIMQNGDVATSAEGYLNEEVPSATDAISGALDILSEAISEDVKMRACTNEIKQNSRLMTTEKDGSLDEKNVFQIYYDFSDIKLSEIPIYRFSWLTAVKSLGF